MMHSQHKCVAGKTGQGAGYHQWQLNCDRSYKTLPESVRRLLSGVSILQSRHGFHLQALGLPTPEPFNRAVIGSGTVVLPIAALLSPDEFGTHIRWWCREYVCPLEYPLSWPWIWWMGRWASPVWECNVPIEPSTGAGDAAVLADWLSSEMWN